MAGESACGPPGEESDSTELRYVVNTVAGCGRTGGSDGPADRASFAVPQYCLPLPDGSLLVTDHKNGSLRRVHNADGQVRVETFGKAAGWLRPKGMALLPDGGILVCDSGHNRLRRISLADGRVTTYAGNGKKGHRDGAADKAQFDCPSFAFVCADASILVTDSGNRCLRILSSVGGRLTVSTVEVAAGPGGGSPFVHPTSAVAVAGADGMMYVSDGGSHTLLALCPSDETRTVGHMASHTASVVAGCAGTAGHADGPLEGSLLSAPSTVAIESDGRCVVCDTQNNCLRRICFASRTITTLAVRASRLTLEPRPTRASRERRHTRASRGGVRARGEGGALWAAD